ncbi:hypothetical protein MNBD_PLANCTO02-2452 [hydrothermal vent metagenome]|uniref:Uncharacterized protein n=1 Tax=hydrothermal vent metagenome TaxID=652676 RepID=A0A3B1D8H1_9ZZZZ
MNHHDLSVLNSSLGDIFEERSNLQKTTVKQKLRVIQWTAGAFGLLMLVTTFGFHDDQNQEKNPQHQTVIAKEKENTTEDSEQTAQKQLAASENNLGLAFAEMAKRASENQRHNEAYLYALKKLNPVTEEQTIAQMVGLTITGETYLTISRATTPSRHTGAVSSVSFSPDGKTIVSGMQNMIRRYNSGYVMTVTIKITKPSTGTKKQQMQATHTAKNDCYS